MSTRPPLIPLALAGILAPIWFTLLVVLQGVLQPDYDHVALPISALAAWPRGWMQNLNFFVFGSLLAAFTLGIHVALRPTRYGVAGIALMLLGCAGIWTAALFPWVNVNGVPTETGGHVVGAVLSFLGASSGLIAGSRRMAADPRWQDLAGYVLATGLAMLALFIALGAFAIDEAAPLHPWVGLLQRVILVLWFPCLIVIARRVLATAAVAAHERTA